MPAAELDAEPVFPSADQLGEGPVWLGGHGLLAWVDILGGVLHLGRPGARTTRDIDLGEHLSAVVPTTDDDVLLAAIRSGLATVHVPSGSVTPLWPGPWATDVRPNETKCGPDGTLWLGTLTDAEAPGTGALYRIDPGLRATTVFTDLTIPNGMDWRDGGPMLFTDTVTGRVDEVQLAGDGTVESRRPFLATAPPGVPDGLTLDGDGGLWVTMHGAGEVRRYGPDCRLQTVVRVPTPSVTSCAFGGDDRRTLFVTTARSLAAPGDVHAGPVYACRPGPRGRAAFAFAPDTAGYRRLRPPPDRGS